MLLSFIKTNYLLFFLVAGLALILRRRKQTGRIRTQPLWLTIYLVLLLAVCDWVERNILSSDPSFRFWRTLFSVIGYWLRPACSLGFINLIVENPKYRRILLIPEIINILVFSTAFFSPIAFYFDENYYFHRGPLGYTVFVVSFSYIIVLLLITINRFRTGVHTESFLLLLCALGCIGASLIEALDSGNFVNPAIIICCIFYYLFLYVQMADRDTITELHNYQSFFEDFHSRDKFIIAAASVDMNGLKAINDSLGHAAGDRALAALGSCMRQLESSAVIPYRTGGDEFILLFFKGTESSHRLLLDELDRSVREKGLNIARGYAAREEGEDIEALIRRSDQLMYANKAEYYRSNGHDRRRR